MRAMKVLSHALWVALGTLASCDQGAPTPTPTTADAQALRPAHETVQNPQKGKKGGKAKDYEYDAVQPNPNLRPPAGFRGDVHPELDRAATLELVARWKPTLPEAKRTGIKLGIIDNASSAEYSVPDDLVALLTESQPAAERVIYGARELSRLLPEKVEGTGQLWAIDLDDAARFLKQFHPGTAMTFDHYKQPYGRRPGPAGAFGVLRAVTPEWLDVVFRIHAEFVLKEGGALYTPACFLGRMLVDRKAHRVAYLEMHVPTDLSVNLNILVTFRLPDDPRKEVTNIIFERIETMELAGGDAAQLARVEAPEAIEAAEAHLRVKKAFYKFLDIDWVPIEEVLETAQRMKRPVMTAVLTSPLDDCSC